MEVNRLGIFVISFSQKPKWICSIMLSRESTMRTGHYWSRLVKWGTFILGLRFSSFSTCLRLCNLFHVSTKIKFEILFVCFELVVLRYSFQICSMQLTIFFCAPDLPQVISSFLSNNFVKNFWFARIRLGNTLDKW